MLLAGEQILNPKACLVGHEYMPDHLLPLEAWFFESLFDLDPTGNGKWPVDFERAEGVGRGASLQRGRVRVRSGRVIDVCQKVCVQDEDDEGDNYDDDRRGTGHGVWFHPESQ